MPRGSGRLVLDDFLGGLNARDDPVDLDVNEALQLADVVPSGEGGAITVRLGDSTIGSGGTGDPLRLFDLASASRITVADDDGDIWSISILGTDHLLYDGAGGSRFHSWFMEAPASGGQGPLWFRAVDSGTLLATYRQSAGTSAASAAWTAATGTLPRGAWFLWVGNRVYMFGVPDDDAVTTTNDSFVWWSELGDPRNWPAANALQLGQGQGRQFTAGGRVGEVLVIFKTDRAWVIYDLDTGANRPLGEDVGATSMDTVCTTPVGLFFIDPGRGPMLTNGTTTRLLENGWKAPWEGFVQAAYANDHIYCINEDDDDRIWDYSLQTKSWWRHNFGTAGASALLGGESMRVGRAGSGAVDHFQLSNGLSTTLSTGGALSPTWDSSHFALGAPTERKRLRKVQVLGAGNASIKLKSEVGGAFTTLKTGALTEPGLLVPTPGVARAPQFQVVRSSGTTFRLDQLVADYSTRQR